MLFPKKVKHRKWHTGRRNAEKLSRPETRGTTLAFGSHGIKATTHGRVRATQIEASRKAISHALGKTGRLWVRIFPDRPYTQKPAEVGMGKGKGDPQGYEFEVKPGRMLFEIDGATDAIARDALRKAGTKLPVRTKIVAR